MDGARLRQPRRDARRRGAHGRGHRPAVHRGRCRRLDRPGPGQLDHQRVPARLRRGHAAGGSRRRPVGRAPDVRHRARAVHRRVRGRGSLAPRRPRGHAAVAHRGAGGPGLRRRRPRPVVDRAGEPPVRRAPTCRGARHRGSGDVRRHGHRSRVRGVGPAHRRAAHPATRHRSVAVDLPAERPDRDRRPADDVRRGRRHRDAAHRGTARPRRRGAAEHRARNGHRCHHRCRRSRVDRAAGAGPVRGGHRRAHRPRRLADARAISAHRPAALRRSRLQRGEPRQPPYRLHAGDRHHRRARCS